MSSKKISKKKVITKFDFKCIHYSKSVIPLPDQVLFNVLFPYLYAIDGESIFTLFAKEKRIYFDIKKYDDLLFKFQIPFHHILPHGNQLVSYYDNSGLFHQIESEYRDGLKYGKESHSIFGKNGIYNKRFYIFYKNGKETLRTIEE